MSTLTDAQTLAIFNAQGEAITEAMSQDVGVQITETVVSGTPFQISTIHAAFLYVSIQTAASLTITMGPTSAGTGVTVAAAASETVGLSTVKVPAGWYVVLTGTVADFTVQAVLE